MARITGLAPASGDHKATAKRLADTVESVAPGQLARGRLPLRSTCDALLHAVPAWLWPALLILAGALLRTVPWLANYPLHRDEALYGYWAQLVIRGSDPGMITAWVDKPPLTLYLLAGSLGLFGISERAMRVPGMVAGVLTIAITYGLARRAGGRRTALLAATLVAASPFAILFGPTAFTDPWLALWLVAAAWAALAGRPAWSGVLLGLAVASKQTGLLGVPLVMALIWANPCKDMGSSAAESRPAASVLRLPPSWAARPIGGRPSHDGRRLAHHGRSLAPCGRIIGRSLAPCGRRALESEGSPDGHKALGYGVIRHRGPITCDKRLAAGQATLALAGFALVMGPVIWWDSLRWGARPSFWTRSLETYGGLHLAHLAEWPERAVRWSEQIGYLFGYPSVTACLLILAVVAMADAWRHRSAASPARGSALTTLILAAYCIAYLAVHFVITFQPWDRYLLPMVPLLAVLAAQGMRTAWQNVYRWRGRRAGFLLRAAPAGAAVLLVWSTWLGMNGQIPVGSGHEAYEGLDQVVTRIRALPWSAVVYQRSLGWQLDFYFFQAPPARIWWDDPQTLVEGALYGVRVMPERQQWLILAMAVDEEAGAAARQALAAHGLDMVERQRIYRTDSSPSYILYEILPSGGPHA